MDSYNDWQEALLQLPERFFFGLMRLYLGEIKTPFNKQHLIERLGAFLLHADTQRTIVGSLDRLDILILTAVHTLPETTRAALVLFLSSETSLQTRLTNLEQRLVLYCSSRLDEQEKVEKAYHINPLLYAAIEPLLDSRSLFLPQRKGELKNGALLCNDIVLAGLYSFFLKEVDVFKIDGSFKMKIEKQLKAIFEDSEERLSSLRTLCKGLENLGLLMPDKSNFVPQKARWEEFFKQKPFDRKMYSIAAVYGRARRDTLQKRAQFLSDFLLSLDPCGLYDETTLQRIFCFLYQRLCTETDSRGSIFPSMLDDVQRQSLDILKGFSFLLQVGEYWQINSAAFSQESEEQALVISPSFELTMFPFTSLRHVFSVLNCLEPISILTVGRFAITRSACLRCFEQGYTDAHLITLLDKASRAHIPQNIKVSISEWYRHCTAISLYHGLVITVAEDKQKLFTQNAELKSLIYKELAQGVYLIKHIDEDSVRSILQSAGLDVTFYSGSSFAQYTPTGFPSIEQHPTFCDGSDKVDMERHADQCEKSQDYSKHIQDLQAFVDTMPIDEYNKSSLKEKIFHKLIITAEQLHRIPIDSEVQEVSGLDFLGKVHLAETAIADKCRVEVSIDGTEGLRVIIGIPLSIEKTEGGAQLLLQDVQTQYKHKIAIARILKMKAFHRSLL